MSAPRTLLTMFELHRVASVILIQEIMVRVTLACSLRTCEGHSECLKGFLERKRLAGYMAPAKLRESYLEDSP